MLHTIFVCAALLLQTPATQPGAAPATRNTVQTGTVLIASALPKASGNTVRRAHAAKGHARQERVEIALITAQGSPYLVEFQSLCGKRPDLRLSVGRAGMDGAFSLWLYMERPAAYNRYLHDMQGGH